MNAQTAGLRVFLYENDAVEGLGPIASTRPAFELRVGALNLRERLALSGFEIGGVRSRPHLTALCLSMGWPDADLDCEFRLDARLDGTVAALGSALSSMAPGERWSCDGAIVAERLSNGSPVTEKEMPEGIGLLRRPWEIVHRNATRLAEDFQTLRGTESPVRRIFGVEFLPGSPRAEVLDVHAWSSRPHVESGAHLLGAENVIAGPGARVRAGAVIDASSGPVILGAGCLVQPLSVVVGPAYLGPGTVVNPGAKLREGTSCGAHCKLGGEIEESVLLDLSNKQHDGFLGHALVGSWVNLGADTNGSDLKNNYGPVRIDLGDGDIETGETFLGPHLADHVKTGIDTMLTTGVVAGVCANVFGGGFTPRHLPAYSWGGAGDLVEYRVDAALQTAAIVFARRDAVWTDEHATLLRSLYERTRAIRSRFLAH